jgi:chloramphenicol 3-O phosphotransferase
VSSASPKIVLLNGAPRSGKSSIADCLIDSHVGWVRDGVDADMAATPASLRPGIGLRPGGERPDLEETVHNRYRALFERLVQQLKSGNSVVVDVGLHHHYASALHPLWDAAEQLPLDATWLVGVHCDLEAILERRRRSPSELYESGEVGLVPAPIVRWQAAVHDPGIYDLRVDTSTESATACAATILTHINRAEPLAMRTISSQPRPESLRAE